MITPTHVVINVAITRWRRAGDFLGDQQRRRLFILGGLAPDVGLYVMAGIAAIYYPTVRELSFEATFRLVFDDLYFNAPAFIVATSLLHAPLVLAALVGLGTWLRRRTTHVRPGCALQAFALGCVVHTALDIAVHHDDGPLLLFPFDLSLRFASPLSYYDRAHYGSVVAPIDLTITVVGTIVIVGSWLLRLRARNRARTRTRTDGAT